MKTKIIQNIKSIIVALVLVAGVAYVSAWTGPTDTAPDSNTAAPINVSYSSQIKQGNFHIKGLINATTAATNGLIVENGNVGIGTMNPQSKLDVVGDVCATVGGVKQCLSSGGNSKFCYVIDAATGTTFAYGTPLSSDTTLKNCRDLAYDACSVPSNRSACRFELACFGNLGKRSWTIAWASTISDAQANTINLSASTTWQTLARGGNQGNFCGWIN